MLIINCTSYELIFKCYTRVMTCVYLPTCIIILALFLQLLVNSFRCSTIMILRHWDIRPFPVFLVAKKTIIHFLKEDKQLFFFNWTMILFVRLFDLIIYHSPYIVVQVKEKECALNIIISIRCGFVICKRFYLNATGTSPNFLFLLYIFIYIFLFFCYIS